MKDAQFIYCERCLQDPDTVDQAGNLHAVMLVGMSIKLICPRHEWEYLELPAMFLGDPRDPFANVVAPLDERCEATPEEGLPEWAPDNRCPRAHTHIMDGWFLCGDHTPDDCGDSPV